MRVGLCGAGDIGIPGGGEAATDTPEPAQGPTTAFIKARPGSQSQYYMSCGIALHQHYEPPGSQNKHSLETR